MRGADEIIKEALKEGPKTPKELLKICSRDVTKQTYYRHLKKLVKQGEIKEPVYVLTEKVKEADRIEVKDCMDAIERAENKDILLDRIDQLLHIVESGRRVAHFPELRLGIEKVLRNPMLHSDPETFSKLAFTLARILEFEQEHSSPDSDQIVKALLDDALPRVISIIDDQPRFPDHASLFFLGKSGREEAVKVLFRKIKNDPSNAMKSQDLSLALGKHGLYAEFSTLINKRFDELMRTDNKLFVEAAKNIRSQIRWSGQ